VEDTVVIPGNVNRSLLGCHNVCPKNLPLQTQIAFLRRRVAATGVKPARKRGGHT